MEPSPLSLCHLIQEPREAQIEPLPLLILSHGFGSNEMDLFDLASLLDPRYFIISVRAPIELSPGAYAWFPIQWIGTDMKVDEQEITMGYTALSQFLDDVLNTYPVDARRVYLMGFSQGAMMSCGVALACPNKVTGFVAMSGCTMPNLPVSDNQEQLSQLPCLVTHGTEDPILPIHYGRASRDRLQALGVQLDYREYAMGHNVNDESLRDIQQWLTAQLD